MRASALPLRVACLLVVAVIGWADFNTNPDARFGFVYLVPIVVAGWWAGRVFALLCATVATVALVLNDFTFHSNGFGLVLLWSEFTRATTFLAAALVSDSLSRSRDQLTSEREYAFQLAIHDPLTGVYNRYFMREQLELLHGIATSHRHPYSVIALDLDGLKELNDRAGHQAGDDALVQFAEDLRASIRPGDLPVRIGGDEFVVVLPDTEVTDAIPIAERVVAAVRERKDSHHSVTGISAGVATWRPDRDIDQVLAVVDRLLYVSKRHGADRSVTSEPAELLRLELGTQR